MPKNIKLNSGHYFIMKILHKRELQQIAFNHSSDIDFKDFMNLTGEEELSSNKRQIIEQAKFAYSSWGKPFEKQIEKQFGALKSLTLLIKEMNENK